MPAFDLEPYYVEYAVGVWRQLELLSEGQRQRLREELLRLSHRSAEQGAPAPGSDRLLRSSTRLLAIEGLIVTYELTHTRRTLTVLSVSRPTAEPG